ncbi:sce7725 family protein [Enterococcus termitis]|uniref:Sce7725 family protein n=1 Tax=Enterococcus termitis TaxID=332950 RepID=A0A1E5GCA0_9ENTE|nr:sce7725 family protein [Enterococcus termitis]OEG09860.1 hypothetical protein BCR25_10170 [Enterococcus termitis]OJG98365.1 hypothetical protein RV18_GL003266 [Enterococcus termitis]
MYYPYFRGKQFDLLALTTLLASGRLSKKIVPIIDPVKNSTTLKKFLIEVQKNEHPFYIVQNPQAGDFLTFSGAEYLTSLAAPKALVIDQPIETFQDSCQLFIVERAAPVLESDWQSNQVPVLISEEFRLLQKVTGPKILSQDLYTRLPKAEFYQECPDELFSTAHLTFPKKGFVGFSDFSIDSRIYYEQSYPSKFLSLHLVYFEQETLRIHHFLATEEGASQKEQFFELMENIIHWEKQLCAGETTLGLDLLLKAFSADKFPGMGVMRKAAVMHHMELMSRYLDKKSEASWSHKR